MARVSLFCHCIPIARENQGRNSISISTLGASIHHQKWSFEKGTSNIFFFVTSFSTCRMKNYHKKNKHNFYYSIWKKSRTFCVRGFISLISISSAFRFLHSSSGERQEGEGVEAWGSDRGERVRIPSHPPAAGTPRAPTRRRRHYIAGKVYHACARHGARHTGKRNVVMETTMATLNQYTRRGVGSFVRSFVGRPVGRWRRRKAHVVLSATCESALRFSHFQVLLRPCLSSPLPSASSFSSSSSLSLTRILL